MPREIGIEMYKNIPQHDIEVINASYREDAEVNWTFEPGGYVWDDELPDAIEEETRFALIMLIAMRNRLHRREKPSTQSGDLWESVKSLLDWPGFRREKLSEELYQRMLRAMAGERSEYLD